MGGDTTVFPPQKSLAGLQSSDIVNNNIKYGASLFEDYATVDPASGNFTVGDYASSAIGSGTLSAFLIEENHINAFGIAKVSCTTTANSGREMTSYIGDKVLRGGEVFKTSVRFPSLSSDVVARLGFFINTDYTRLIVGKTVKSGAYFDLSNGVLVGKITLNGVSVTTNGSFTPVSTVGKYYRLEVSTEWTGVSSGTLGTPDDFFATFKIYDGNTLVFSETIRLNYYTGAYGYQYGGSNIVVQSTGTTAKEVLRIDYIGQYSTKEFVR